MKKVSLLCLYGVMALGVMIGDAWSTQTNMGTIKIPVGAAGTSGANGASAYQIWLNNGHSGTEAEFLASLIGAQGPQGEPGVDGATPISCEAQITMSDKDTNTGCYTISTQKRKANTAGTACENDGAAVSKQVCDGANGTDGQDGVGVCDGITLANLSKTVKNTTSVYTAGTSTTVGYLTNTRTMCDNSTETTDKVEDACVQVKDARTSGACNGAYLVCTNQTTDATYNVCKEVAGQNISSLSSAISAAQSAADNAQSTADSKVDTTTFTTYQSTVASTYASKDDVYTKTQVDNAIGTATSGLATETYVDSAVANKQDTLTTAQLAAVNSGITSGKITTYDGYATTIANKADKATTLAGYGITDAYTKTQSDNTYLTQTNASSTYLNKTDAASTYLSRSAASSTYLTQTDASSTYATKSTVETLSQTVNGTCGGSEGSAIKGIGSEGSGESSGSGGNCTASLESRIAALEAAVAALQSN